METAGLNNPQEKQDEPPLPELPEQPKTEDLKPTSKGVENAKKRLRAFSIQKKSSLSPVPLPKPICTTVGAVGTVFIGKLASSKPALKPGDIEEVVDSKKPPKPPKPGTSKLQNADYLNIQKKTLSEIEAMKRKMELVDLGIPLGLICPATNGDKAMPTKAMPPIKSMLLACKMRVLHPDKKEAKIPLKRSRHAAAAKNPAKVDEIIREAKKAKAEGKPFKFSYEKLLPSYQNPFQKNKDKDKDKETPLSDDRQSRDRRKYSDSFRRYSSHKDEKRSRDWHRESKDRVRASVIREREIKEEKMKLSKEKSKKDVRKDSDGKSKDKDVKYKGTDAKEKIDTINLSDDDDEVQEVTEAPEKNVKETDVNLKDFVVCDSWSENEDKKDPTPSDKRREKEITTPEYVDPMEQLKQSLTKETELVPMKVEKLQPVTDTFKFEIEDDNDDEEILDMFAESTSFVKKSLKKIPLPTVKKDLYDSPVPMRFDYDASVNDMDESFLESVIAEIKQEDIDEDTAQDKGLVEYDISPKDERESVTPEIDDRIREMYSRSEYSDGFKSVESVKSSESGFKSTESGYKSIESGYKSESRTKSKENNFKFETKQSNDRSKSNDSNKTIESGYKSTESNLKSKESGYKSTDSDRKSIKRLKDDASVLQLAEPPRTEVNMSKAMVDSLETWSFVLKICQPLLFRHDKNKCYKETRVSPKLWWAENPKLCDCVRDRSVVYEELEMCKMDLVNSVYGSDQVVEADCSGARDWYGGEARGGGAGGASGGVWGEGRRPPAPCAPDEMLLDREYQKFMEAVWPEVEGPKSETPRSTPVRETKKRPAEEVEGKKKRIRMEGGMSSEGWSQDSEVEEELENKKQKVEKFKRKRKYSSAMSESDDESTSKKKKALKKEKKDKKKLKATKRQRLSKKYLKKLKEKQLKKKRKLAEESDAEDLEKEKKRKEKKLKKKKLLKKKKSSKKKSRARSSSSSSSDSDSDRKSRKKDKKKKRRKRKQSSSDSNQSDEIFDVNILKNIKTERLTDDEKKNFSPNKKHREIINVKQLQSDFVSCQIKKEIEDVNSPDEFEESFTEEEKKQMEKRDADRREAIRRESEKELEKKASEKRELERVESEKKELERVESEKRELERVESEKRELERVESEKRELERTESEKRKFERVESESRDTEKKQEEIIESVQEKAEIIEVASKKDKHEFKEPETTRPLTPQSKTQQEETNSQSSQDSVSSIKPYEKDESHLRPSSQNSNYNFHDVMENEGHAESELYQKGRESEMEEYEQGNYEMYEQMAMEYQSDVASQRVPPPDAACGRIETVVRARVRGEIKCDWRAGDPPSAPPPGGPLPTPRASRWGAQGTDAQRPSRWGLKPNEVNIVLTGGEGEPSEGFPAPIPAPAPAVYQIESLANRTENSNTGYDEAYMDMYGASDRLQYGDCFAREIVREVEKKPVHSSLDDRINLALQTTVLGEVAKDDSQQDEGPDKGILITKSLAEPRSVKRVSFADGYKPGQDSDTEEPPVRKRKKVRRVGCPWPCPASHADHVSLWDALPPPPPPPGSPPPPPRTAPPPHLLRSLRPAPRNALPPPHHGHKFDPNSLAAFMPPEPPPGLISF